MLEGPIHIPFQTIISHSNFIRLLDAFRSIYTHKMQYEPLDKTKNEIRVLEFLDLPSPVPTEDTIRCSIKNVSLQSSLDSRPHQKDPQKRKFPIAWDKFTKSVDLRDSALEQTTLDAAIHAGLHRRFPQCDGSRYEWGDFEALSYAWGNTRETKTIYVDGVFKSVPRNLEEALRALRDLEETFSGMCYWVDSLCIDQENIEERNEQVKRMKEIYSQARAVIVWLGQEEEMDRVADQMMRELCHGAGNTPQPPSSFLLNEWPALFAFAQKPYWNRCWIIQELAMNHNSTLFLCGGFKLTRKMIQMGAGWSLASFELSGNGNEQLGLKLQLSPCDMAERMGHLIDLTPENDIGINLNSLLDLVRRADATDERDKIYSILGLLRPAISAGVIPNYTLSLQQVYTNFMESVINASKRLDDIPFRDISAEQGWPSWIPDWRMPFQRHYIQFLIILQASRDIPAQFRLIEEGKDRAYLVCSGFEIDTVDAITAEPPLDSHATRSSNVSERYSGRILKAIQETFCMGYSAIRTELLPEVPWNLSGDTSDNMLSSSSWRELFHSSYFERWDKFRRYNETFCIGGQKLRTFFAQSDEQSVDIASTLHYMRSALLSLHHRVLITTGKGQSWWAPVEVRRGDVIVILDGCASPVVLRPYDDGNYQFIGECYTYGPMNGVIPDQQQNGRVSEQEFILC